MVGLDGWMGKISVHVLDGILSSMISSHGYH